MSQDTRKDKRAKVVSLNVRYKSATVDEFIENHSHDVSKGGIFVKTPTPFPPGTLLKFEIRLAGDKSVISGVGRVVWKREPTQAASEKPAGMGVKFIKIDDASRAVIDRLVAQKADAGSAYTSDPAALEEEAKPAGQPITLRGIPSAAPLEPTPAAPATSPAAPAPPPSSKPAIAAKAPPQATTTQMSAGTPAAPAAPPAPGSAPGATKTAGATGARAPRLDKTIPMGTSPLAGLPQFNKGLAGANPPPAAAAAAPPAAAPAAKPAGGGPPAPIQHRPATAIGVAPPPAVLAGASAAPSGGAASAAPPVARQSEPRLGAVGQGPGTRPQQNPRKATMMGVGLPSPSSAPGAGANQGGQADIPTPLAELTPQQLASAKVPEPTPSPKPAAASPMFPKGGERDYESVQEPTVMKQAAELLEEALREAGGSLDEIGQNPLFSQSSQRGGAVQEQKPPDSTDPHSGQSGDTVMMQSPMAPKVGATVPSSPPQSHAPSHASASPARSGPPAALAPTKPVGASLRPPASEKKSGSGGLIAGLLVVAVLVGGGVYAYKSGALAGVIGGAQPTATPSTPASTPSTLPTPSGTDSSALSPAALGDGGNNATGGDGGVALATGDGGATALAVSDAGSDASAKDAGGAGALTVQKPAPPPPPPPKPKPKPPPPPPTDTAEPTAKPEPTSAPTSAPTKDPEP